MSDENPRNLQSMQGVGGDPEVDRRVKLARLREEFNLDPFGRRIDGLMTLADARRRHDPAADEAAKAEGGEDKRAVVKVAGRIVLHRDTGKLVFMTLRDHSGDLQVAVSKRAVDEQSFKLAKLADLGDIVLAEGPIGTTKTGEITVWATTPAESLSGGACPAFTIVTKSLAPPPEKFKGLQDPELRYRRRYVDLSASPEVMDTFRKRSRIVKAVRDFLTDPPPDLAPGYIEVETPMMQPIAGGAAARPFITHHNALDIDLFMRIAPELYLKRLLVGGMNRVFEINRNFRNEGIDRSHNPEFTMLELYQAFGDLYSVMELTERLINHIAVHVIGSETLSYGEVEISYALPFRRAKYHDLFREVNGFDPADRAQLEALAHRHHIAATGKDRDVMLNEVWEETVEHTLVQPTFVIDYPGSLCPLTKRKPREPHLAERFELFVANMELANAYTELNDPDVQKANFEQQVAGEDDEAATFRTLDDDFIDALKVGMPPAGGLGVGIDRLVMLLTNHRSIRDVILFPLLQPHFIDIGADMLLVELTTEETQRLQSALESLSRSLPAELPPRDLEEAVAAWFRDRLSPRKVIREHRVDVTRISRVPERQWAIEVKSRARKNDPAVIGQLYTYMKRTNAGTGILVARIGDDWNIQRFDVKEE